MIFRNMERVLPVERSASTVIIVLLVQTLANYKTVYHLCQGLTSGERYSVHCCMVTIRVLNSWDFQPNCKYCCLVLSTYRHIECVFICLRSTVQVASMLISSQVSQRPSRGQQGVQSDVLVENPVELVFTFDEVHGWKAAVEDCIYSNDSSSSKCMNYLTY